MNTAPCYTMSCPLKLAFRNVVSFSDTTDYIECNLEILERERPQEKMSHREQENALFFTVWSFSFVPRQNRNLPYFWGETGIFRIAKRKDPQLFREFWLRGHFDKMDSCPCLISIKCSSLSCEKLGSDFMLSLFQQIWVSPDTSWLYSIQKRWNIFAWFYEVRGKLMGIRPPVEVILWGDLMAETVTMITCIK